MDLLRLSEQIESISRTYADRVGIERDDAWFLLKLQEEMGELTQAYLMRTGQARTRGLSREEIDRRFGEELADLLCHVLLLARHHGVDLEGEVGAKWLAWLSRTDEAGRTEREARTEVRASE